ncbi:unnamed protein product [Closterium sp. NIES-54]
MVTTTTPGGQRVSICTCTRTGRHLATFTRWPGSSLYTLAIEPPMVASSAQVSASGPVAPSCSCRLLSHQTLLWHHRLGHPSLPRLRGMHSRLLVSGLPRSLPPLPPSPAPPCLPCIEGRQRAAPHSSSFPPTTAPLQTLHMDIGGEFSSNLLRDFCRGKGILLSFTLPDSPQQNGIVEHRIGLVMEVARTSMIHAAAPHFLWPFAVRYAAHQLKLWPRVSLPETSPTLRWTGKVGDASMFRSWVLVPLFAIRPRQALRPRYSLHPLRGIVPVEVAVDSGAARGAASGGAELACAERGGAEPAGAEPGGAESVDAGFGGAEPWGAELGGAEPPGVEPGGAESAGAEPGGAELERTEPGGTLSTEGPLGALSRRGSLSPPQLREWFAWRTRLRRGADVAGCATGVGVGGTRAGAVGRNGAASPGGARIGGTGAGGTAGVGAGGIGAGATGGTGAAGAGGAAGVGAGGTGAGAAEGSGAAGSGGARTGGTGAAGAGGAASVGTGDPGAGGAAGVGAGDPGARGAGPGGASALGAASPLPAPSPYTEKTRGLIECREPDSCPALPIHAVRTGRCVPRPRPPSVPGTHHMALRPSSVPLHVPLPSPPSSSLAKGPNPESDLVRVASPTVPRLLATVVTEPSFETAAASALVAELVDFAAACRLDYAASLVAESESDCPLSVGGECALGTDVLEDRHEDFECFAAAIPHLVSMLIAPEGDPDAPDIPTPRYYAEAISCRMMLAARGFAPSTADPSLLLRTDSSLSLFYVLVYVDDLVFATADTEALALVKSELQKRHTCTDLGELCSYLGLQITRDRVRCIITLTQLHMVHQVLQCFGFQYSSPQSTPLPTGHSLSAPSSDESVELSGPYPELVGCLMYLMTCTRPDLAYPLSILPRYVVPGRHRPEHWEAAKWVLRYLCCISGMGLVFGGRGPVVLTGHANASWVDDLATQRSSQGYTFSLGSGSGCPTSCAALPCPSRRPAGCTLPCPAHRDALQAEHFPALPVAPPCQSRAALPCQSRAALPCLSRLSNFPTAHIV